MSRDGDIGGFRTDPKPADDLETGAGLTPILDAIDIPVALIGGDCKIAGFNRPAADLFCLTASDVGQAPSRISGGVPDLEQVCAAAIADGTESRREIRNGDHWLLIRIVPYHGPDRQSGAVLSFSFQEAADISDRSHAELNANLLAAIVESSDDAIVSKNLDGIIMSWNRGAARLFGYTAAEAIGQSIALIIPPDRLEEEPKILERLKRGERVEHFETIRITKDGSRLNISLTISPVRDAHGRIVGASKVARDVTPRVRQQEALQAANAALERANADLQYFAYSASHDLQEPLRAVGVYAELLQRRFGNQLGPSGDEFIGHILEGARRLESLLRDLRLYMQVSTTDQSPTEEIDAGEVLAKTLLNLEVTIRESEASIESGPLPRVRMHEFQLEQLFQNLIGNAIRYRSELPPRIQIGATRTDEGWLFSVADNGIGIEPQFQEQIFGVFNRLHTGTETSGTGMGLAICKRILELLKGRIWVESELGKGATFYFTVPDGASALESSRCQGRIRFGQCP